MKRLKAGWYLVAIGVILTSGFIVRVTAEDKKTCGPDVSDGHGDSLGGMRFMPRVDLS